MPSTRPPCSLGKSAFIRFLLAVFLLTSAGAQHITPKEILVIYNKADPESGKLAEAYQNARGLPDSRLLGLDLPLKQDISRGEYEKTIVAPIRKYMDEQQWWKRESDAQGLLIPSENKIRAILLMRGVPLRIIPGPTTPPKEGEKAPADPISHRDEASVDSELAMFGIKGLAAKGVLKNAFFDSKIPLSEAKLPYLVLTSRIDGPTYAICKRMIADAVAAEKNGLWGRAYVDIANKLPQGDQWLEAIVSNNREMGIPTVTDRFNDTLPKNYPLTEAALYYGWYDWNVSGPFLNTGFQFRQGAVAIHLHSFSAQQLTDAHKNWCAPLLVRGAAATVGNVYEPYLHLTHHFSILHDRLLKGWTFAEAAWASMPVTSWQGIILGDPLYRPFRHINGTGKNRTEDRDFRALRAASRQWPDDDSLRRGKLSAAAEKLKSGTLAEGLAMDFRESKDLDNAKLWIAKARDFFPDRTNKLRQDLQLISIMREQGKKHEAIQALRTAKETYGTFPEADSVSGWLDILDPPPPPVADPTKTPK
ncbi:MAG: TIGR03790 family protein [Verrucomicrobia bacterium]|nr:TIGR03790 family protein [Verrucomicrobiota bacterium]